MKLRVLIFAAVLLLSLSFQSEKANGASLSLAFFEPIDPAYYAEIAKPNGTDLSPVTPAELQATVEATNQTLNSLVSQIDPAAQLAAYNTTAQAGVEDANSPDGMFSEHFYFERWLFYEALVQLFPSFTFS